MTDYLAQFTPDELELIRAQNGKFTVHDNVLHFDIDLPDALIEKMSYLSFRFYADNVNDPETRKETIVHPEENARRFLALFGLTDEKSDKQPKGIRLKFDENTAQLQITHKNYSGALLPQKNNFAYVVNIDQQLQFVWDENGEPRITTVDDQTAYDELLNKKTIPAKCVDTDLLATLLSAVDVAYRGNYGYIITVYLPDFARALGVRIENNDEKDPALNNHFDFWNKIKQLENLGGVLVEKKKIQRAFTLLEYNREENTLTFASPYLYSVMDILKANPAKISKQKKDNKPLYLIQGKSYLVSSKIITARNKATSQAVHYVIQRLFEHGIKTDATRHPHKQHNDKKLVTVTMTYKDLIKNTPLLKEALQEAEPKRRGQILTRAVFGDSYNERSTKKQTTLLEKYLKEYTDAFNYWLDLTITCDPVTMKDLNKKITITHHGINGAFEERLHVPQVEVIDDIFDDN